MPRPLNIRAQALLRYLVDHPGALSSRVVAEVYGDAHRATGYRNLGKAERLGLVAMVDCDQVTTLVLTPDCPNLRHAHVIPGYRGLELLGLVEQGVVS
jgi:hypothetical protein